MGLLMALPPSQVDRLGGTGRKRLTSSCIPLRGKESSQFPANQRTKSLDCVALSLQVGALEPSPCLLTCRGGWRARPWCECPSVVLQTGKQMLVLFGANIACRCHTFGKGSSLTAVFKIESISIFPVVKLNAN